METPELLYLDKRLNKIVNLLEEGNANVLSSTEELHEKIGHLDEKVDKVQDTVAYIKKKLTTFTPFKLAFTIIILLGLWVITLYYFQIVDRRLKDTTHLQLHKHL